LNAISVNLQNGAIIYHNDEKL